jgi:transcriptional regulator GlxA family with amidase domain
VWLNLRQDQRIRAVVAGRDEDDEFGILYVRAVLVDPLLKSLLKETLEKELESDDYGAHVLVKNRMVDAMIGMIRQLELEDQGQTVKHWQKSVVSEVVDYLDHHSTERVELQDLAEHMAISVKHLNRIFKEATGTTIVNYANNIRLEQAKYYLTTTDLKIKDIAQLLNYYDQYHFGRIFKQATGKSPVEFRKDKREE